MLSARAPALKPDRRPRARELRHLGAGVRRIDDAGPPGVEQFVGDPHLSGCAAAFCRPGAAQAKVSELADALPGAPGTGSCT
jgi:hypothetical protein